MINSIFKWRNKYLDPNYELTTFDKVLGWVCFFGFGIIIALPVNMR